MAKTKSTKGVTDQQRARWAARTRLMQLFLVQKAALAAAALRRKKPRAAKIVTASKMMTRASITKKK
jgi:hypothetical protein